MMVLACGKETPISNSQFTLQLTNKATNIIRDSIYTMIDGRNYIVNKFNIYLSDFTFIDNASQIHYFDTILLLSNNASFELPLPNGNYKQIIFHIGIDSVTNNSVNPLLLPSNHPLSLSQDMFWDMTRYRFIVWEGSYNNSTSGDGIPNAPYTFHLGRDVLYQNVVLNNGYVLDAHNTLLLDINKIMYNTSDTLSLLTTFSNHSNDSEMQVAKVLMGNLADAFSLK
jgi:hypothetical protein